MATTLGKRRKKAAQPTAQDLVIALAKGIGIDLTEEYNAESFAQLWVDLYQSEDPDSYLVQGEYLYNLFMQLQALLAEQQESTAIVAVERKTVVWYQGNLQVVALTDAELVDTLTDLSQELVVRPVLDTDNENLLFLAVGFDD